MERSSDRSFFEITPLEDEKRRGQRKRNVSDVRVLFFISIHAREHLVQTVIDFGDDGVISVCWVVESDPPVSSPLVFDLSLNAFS